MSEESKEKEPILRKVEIGEWFTPFANYHDFPYSFHREDHQSKSFKFEVGDLGMLDFHLFWDTKDQRVPVDAERHLVFLLVLPNSEKIIEDTNMKDEQVKMETKIMQLVVGSNDPERTAAIIASNLEIELPSGSIISIPFKRHDPGDGETTAICTDFEFEGCKIHDLVIPEAENILEKMQVKVVKNTEDRP